MYSSYVKGQNSFSYATSIDVSGVQTYVHNSSRFGLE